MGIQGDAASIVKTIRAFLEGVGSAVLNREFVWMDKFLTMHLPKEKRCKIRSYQLKNSTNAKMGVVKVGSNFLQHSHAPCYSSRTAPLKQKQNDLLLRKDTLPKFKDFTVNPILNQIK